VRGYKTEGIVIKRINFAETDRILIIFSKHYGKIKVIAKGARRTKSRKGGNLELFNHLQLFIQPTRGFDILTEIKVIETFAKLRQNLKLVVQAFQIAEALDKLTPEKQASRCLFELFQTSLCDLNQGKEGVVKCFEIALLKELGFGLPKQIDSRSIKKYIESISEKKLISKNFPIHDRTKEAIL